MAASSNHQDMDDELHDRVPDIPRYRDLRDGDGESQRPRAHSVLPPSSRRPSYEQRPDPRTDPRAMPNPRRQSTSAVGLPAPAPGYHSPPPGQQQPYYTQDAFGAHAYIEPRAAAQPHHQMPPPPPPPGQWGGYQLPPPQGYPGGSRQVRSPGPYDPRDPRGQYRPPQQYGYPGGPGYGPPGPPYGPGPSGATVNPNIFKPDPYGHPGMSGSPGPDPSRPDVQITYTDDSATKLTQYLRRRCFNCRVTEPPGWRKSTLNPGKIVCNKCGLYERSHARPRPLHMDNPKGPAQ